MSETRIYADADDTLVGNPDHIQQRVCDHAAELAQNDPAWDGPGRFGVRHYRKALAALSLPERRAERGLVRAYTVADSETDAELQGERARAHFAERQVHFVRSGLAKNLGEASLLAVAESPQIAARAGVGPEALEQPRLDRGRALLTERTYAARALNDSQQKLANLTEADVIRLLTEQVGRGELHRWRPFVRMWAGLQVPSPRPGSAPRGPGADPVNAIVERVWQAARQERLRTRGFTD